MTSSDHRPVRALFTLARALVGEEQSLGGAAVITNLRCVGLPVMDGWAQGGLCDPYLESRILGGTADSPGRPAVRTATASKTLNPEWHEPLIVPFTACASALMLLAKDADFAKEDETIGATVLPISRTAVGGVRFEQPLLRDGQVHGRVEGILRILF